MGKWPTAFCLILMLMASCKAEKKHVAYTPADELAAKAVDEVTDSLSESDDGEPMPLGADELFDDFFFNYATSMRLQLERTSFPLPVFEDGDVAQMKVASVASVVKEEKTIGRKQWKMERFFMQQDYYTLIFDSPEQMELVKDTTIDRVIVERILMDEDRVCQFLFERVKGLWQLSELHNQQLARNPNAQFLKFYEQFVSDSVFHHQSLSDQISFVGPDPEDDFQTIEGVITPDFWDAFAPEFPQNELYNIVYGHQNPAATQKIFVIRGIANGLEVEVTFRLQQGRWKVTRLIT